ncbi:transcriptional coactivator p15/PC4 family protein [Paraburkholderia kirstenboschensis]|uniref:Transcriptional coactivator p15/PC4 family protein n=1 Tax=Paraburkholderia kirstenboschensis TaxID=1245436 RepID=A0ABZ0EP61_9BURK|nr:transcriptional coactivator p15/PC4 family protein [Paraburkholderia kirstenboschensis]WOD18964.1 transcriptional coactivator p15/PC4 family protein [Paraburkholderia kirstenboschensis]
MTDEKKADPQASQKNSKASAHANTSSTAGTAFIDLRKSDSERLRITISEYRGRTLVDLRVWYSTESGEFKPGRAGVSLRPDQVPEIVQGLMLAARAIDPKGAN